MLPPRPTVLPSRPTVRIVGEQQLACAAGVGGALMPQTQRHPSEVKASTYELNSHPPHAPKVALYRVLK